MQGEDAFGDHDLQGITSKSYRTAWRKRWMRGGGWWFGEEEDGGDRRGKERKPLRSRIERWKNPTRGKKTLPSRHPVGRKILCGGKGGRWLLYGWVPLKRNSAHNQKLHLAWQARWKSKNFEKLIKSCISQDPQNASWFDDIESRKHNHRSTTKSILFFFDNAGCPFGWYLFCQLRKHRHTSSTIL